MDKGHGEEKREGVVNERSADLMRWYVFSITPSSTPVWDIWTGLWNQTSLQRVSYSWGKRRDVWGARYGTGQDACGHNGAKVSLEFHLFSSFYCILK